MNSAEFRFIQKVEIGLEPPKNRVMPYYNKVDLGIEKRAKLLEKVKELLKTDEFKSTPEILDEVTPHEDWDSDRDDWTHTRNMLGLIRKYMKREGEIEVETRREGGQPTYYWRKTEQQD